MRVAYTSDLHVDVSKGNRELLPYLAERVEQIAPDVFVIAGDVANSLSGLDAALQAFSSLDCLKVMVPGNHDVWVESACSICNVGVGLEPPNPSAKTLTYLSPDRTL